MIVADIKKLLGVGDEDFFDKDIIMQINSAMFTLRQLGVKLLKNTVEDTDIWSDIIETDELEAIKSYIYLKTRLVFDPPTTSYLINVVQDEIKQLEWRINVDVDIPKEVEKVDDPE